ncbi:uncharacterized protein LOC126680144 isoform X2 [Mercurialis annua]|uniref:uncharacterized protein LOC126680144 isoform X2 n=1 Tax=Mercurialis annua TaxID=3986 RepID=UPI0024AE33FD|nr:uncharacterized protein LOC126680144 isoform X2 [Mercurialis annua]
MYIKKWNLYEESEFDGEDEESESVNHEMEATTENVQCMILHRAETSKKGEELSLAKYGVWRQDQKSRAARLQKQLKARWELEQLIQEQLSRFNAHYNCTMVPTRLKEVAEFLMPKWAPPHELAAVTWLGEWRPSAILDLLRGLTNTSSTSWTSSLRDSNGIDRLLSQVINEIRIEEAIIEAEMAEIQATCVLYLPFSPLNNHRPRNDALSCIQAEFNKIQRVITKAQQLRYKALELVVKKVLVQTDAAQFLVAFVEIQDLIHKFAERQKLPKLPANVPVKSLSHISKESKINRF